LREPPLLHAIFSIIHLSTRSCIAIVLALQTICVYKHHTN
jgi:hypothetical protein